MWKYNNILMCSNDIWIVYNANFGTKNFGTFYIGNIMEHALGSEQSNCR